MSEISCKPMRCFQQSVIRVGQYPRRPIQTFKAAIKPHSTQITSKQIFNIDSIKLEEMVRRSCHIQTQRGNHQQITYLLESRIRIRNRNSTQNNQVREPRPIRGRHYDTEKWLHRCRTSNDTEKWLHRLHRERNQTLKTQDAYTPLSASRFRVSISSGMPEEPITK